MSDRTKAAILIFFLVLTVYSNSLGGKFVSDDEYFVVRNVAIRSLHNIQNFFTDRSAAALSDLSLDVYRPITTLSYAIDYFFWKMNTFGYHLVNVFFHSMSAVLLLIILCALFGDVRVAALASLFFALHPVQTEVVAWISGRSSVLFLFFYLSAFLLYIRGKTLLSLALFAFSLLSKEMAVTLPVLLIAYDAHFPKKGPASKRILRYVPYFVLTAAFILLRAVVIKRVSQCGLWGDNPYYTFLSMAVSFFDYVKVLVLPVDLCAFHISEIYTTVFYPKVFAGVLLLAASLVSVPFVFRRSRRASFFICWFFITILPVTNIVPLKALMAERFLYIPSIGFAALLAMLLGRRKKAAMLALAVSIVVTYSILTMARNEDWKDPVFLAKSIIRVSPQNEWGYMCLGGAYLGDDRYAEAEKAFKKAIALAGDYSSPKTGLGVCYLNLGRHEEAIKLFKESLSLDPRDVDTISSLGVCYGKLKRYGEAIKQFKDAIAVNPTFVAAYLNLGATYEAMSDLKEASEVYKTALQKIKSPQDIALIHVRIGDVYLKTNKFTEAGEEYRKAVSICGGKFPELEKIALSRFDNITRSEKKQISGSTK